jgi:hypothetical protein
MKKLFLVLLILFVFYSCQNSDSNSSDGNAGMLKKIIRHNYNASSNLQDEIYDFFYSNGNKLDYFTWKSTGADYEGIIATRKLTYSENDLIIKKERKTTSNSFPNAVFGPEMEYQYNNSNKLIKSIRWSNQDSGFDTYDFDHLSNGDIKFLFNNTSTGTIKRDTIKFDTNKNLIKNNYPYSGVEMFQYDNKLSPYYGVVGLDKIYFLDELSSYDFYPEYYNNIINRNEISFSYEYNNYNKPTKKISSTGSVLVEYFYY